MKILCYFALARCDYILHWSTSYLCNYETNTVTGTVRASHDKHLLVQITSLLKRIFWSQCYFYYVNNPHDTNNLVAKILMLVPWHLTCKVSHCTYGLKKDVMFKLHTHSFFFFFFFFLRPPWDCTTSTIISLLWSSKYVT